MLPEDLLKKVRQIELGTRRKMDDMLTGGYKSHFKGQGVQFSEHRVYVPGDDIRHIDWKVSARSRDPLVKKYDEERELNVFLIVDVSRSEQFGTVTKTKEEIAAEVAAMLAYAANISGDKVGALLFAGEVERIIPPKKGRSHLMRIVTQVLSHRAATNGTRLDLALDSALRIMKHSGVVFIISDFITEGYESALRRLAKKHDVVAVQVEDARETEIPEVGSIFFLDPETGEEGLVNTSSYRFKTWFKKYLKERDERLKSLFVKSGVDRLQLSTRDDYADAVVKFFRARSRRRK